MNKANSIISWEKLVPIILGVALSGLSTLMSFAYDNMDELHTEIVEHRLLLSRLISPDGTIIQSPTTAKAKSEVIQTISEIRQSIVRLETKVEHLEKERR